MVVVFDFLSRHMLDWPGPNEAILIPVAQLLGRLVVKGFNHATPNWSTSTGCLRKTTLMCLVISYKLQALYTCMFYLTCEVQSRK